MPKRKRKIWYIVSCKDYWYKKGKFIHQDKLDILAGCSSSAFFIKTRKKAERLITQLPSDAVLTRVFYRNGHRMMLDFIKN